MVAVASEGEPALVVPWDSHAQLAERVTALAAGVGALEDTSDPAPDAEPDPEPEPAPEPDPAPDPEGGYLIITASDLAALPTSGSAWDAMVTQADQSLRLRPHRQRHLPDQGRTRPRPRPRHPLRHHQQRPRPRPPTRRIGHRRRPHRLRQPPVRRLARRRPHPTRRHPWPPATPHPDPRGNRQQLGHLRRSLTHRRIRLPRRHPGPRRRRKGLPRLDRRPQRPRRIHPHRGLRGHLACNHSKWTPVNNDCGPRDGAIVEDASRAGPYPNIHADYVGEAFQGATLQALLLDRQGHDAFTWSDHGMCRAGDWIDRTNTSNDWHRVNCWTLHTIDAHCDTTYADSTAFYGRNFGFTGWLN